MIEQKNGESFGAMITAFVMAFVTWLAHVNWLTVVGTIISAGWFVMGAVQFWWKVQDRREKRSREKAR